MKVIRTTNVGDVVVTVLGATDGWTTGDNAFALEFDSAPRKRLVDVDAPALTATALAIRSERLRASARLAAGLILVATFGFTPSRAEAYRPFMSTDAAVADPKALEIELG